MEFDWFWSVAGHYGSHPRREIHVHVRCVGSRMGRGQVRLGPSWPLFTTHCPRGGEGHLHDHVHATRARQASRLRLLQRHWSERYNTLMQIISASLSLLAFQMYSRAKPGETAGTHKLGRALWDVNTRQNILIDGDGNFFIRRFPFGEDTKTKAARSNA